MQQGSYGNIRGHLTFLRDSYRGGYFYTNPAQSILNSVSISDTAVDKDGFVIPISTTNFSSYLTPYDGESASSFSNRTKTAAYINLVRPVVSAYVDAATSKVSRNFGKLGTGISSDIDTQGSSYDEFLRNAATDSCVYGWTFVVVDVQPNDPTKVRYVLVDPTKVERVVVDDYGKIEDFLYITQAEIANAAAPAIQSISAVRINSSGISILQGTVDYNKGYDPNNLKVVSNVPLAPGLNGQLPVIVSFYQKDTSSLIPMGISLVETQAQIGREVYNLQSYSQDILRMHFPQLIYPIKASNGSLTPEAQRAMGTKVALTYDSETNAPSFISPSKDSTDALKAQSDWLIEKAMAAAYLDLNSSSGVNSSGFALTIKSREFENAVKRFAKELSKFETKLLDISAKIVGIQGDPAYSVNYPDNFSPIDISSALQTVKTVLDLSKEYDIGETAKKEALIFIVTNALGLSDEINSKMIKEISKANTAPAIVPAPEQIQSIASQDQPSVSQSQPTAEPSANS